MKFKTPGQPDLPASPGMRKGEKARLIAMVVALVLVLVAFGAAIVKSRAAVERGAAERSAMLPTESAEEVVATVSLPPIDGAAVEALVRDGDRAARVQLEPEALDLVAGWARQLTPRHFEALEAPFLATQAELDVITADPAGHRGAPVRFRAGVEELRARNWSDGDREGWLVRAALEGGGHAYFFALDLDPELRNIGPFLRFDGLFLKTFATEGEDGWIEAPLFVGPRPTRSFPAIARDVDLADSLAAVNDDGLDRISGLPFLPNWSLMAHAASVDEATLDWSGAVELNKVSLGEMTQDGAAFRGRLVTIPISQVMALKVRKAGENPARIDEYTEGWIGNTTWSEVIQFKMPGVPGPEVREGGYATGRGYFLKSLAYEPRDGGLHIAPYVVLTSLDAHIPRESRAVSMLMWGFGGGTVLLGGLFFALLTRDKKRSEQLQLELLRRRKARRAKAAEESAASAAGAEANA